ncbi:hypothetical protein [Arthrobacter sp. CAN_C5]|uniref:hypothetical protein n=1 Tax=Arthrobacter sp. CAN_C5 TaxID=2760706 RepID=UPI001AE98A53|nr:hypothetical protein [Arthrobacter sp. CAN_C5]MBP2216708.1 hypothetical protein [Arthrobacter sp. CAN_C5]
MRLLAKRAGYSPAPTAAHQQSIIDRSSRPEIEAVRGNYDMPIERELYFKRGTRALMLARTGRWTLSSTTCRQHNEPVTSGDGTDRALHRRYQPVPSSRGI